MHDPKQHPTFDPRQMIVDMTAVHLLLELQVEGNTIVLSQARIQELLSNYALRLEIVDPTTPQTSDIKIGVITLAEAQAMAAKVAKTVDRRTKK